jgi:hypothetical protein
MVRCLRTSNTDAEEVTILSSDVAHQVGRVGKAALDYLREHKEQTVNTPRTRKPPSPSHSLRSSMRPNDV